MSCNSDSIGVYYDEIHRYQMEMASIILKLILANALSYLTQYLFLTSESGWWSHFWHFVLLCVELLALSSNLCFYKETFEWAHLKKKKPVQLKVDMGMGL